jgi:hypothetical protein
MNALEPDRRPSYQTHAKSRSQTGAPPSNERLPFAASPFTFHVSTFHQFLKRVNAWNLMDY